MQWQRSSRSGTIRGAERYGTVYIVRGYGGMMILASIGIRLRLKPCETSEQVPAARSQSAKRARGGEERGGRMGGRGFVKQRRCGGKVKG